MATNKYKGNSSAYGYGKVLKDMNMGGFMDSHYGGSQASNPIVKNQTASQGVAPTPSTPQVSQLAMGSGSDPRGNAAAMYKDSITKGNQAPTMPNMTSSTTLKTASTPDYSQNNFDLPDFTNQGYGPKEFGSVGRGYSEEDVDILKQMSGARDDFERRKRSISGPDSMYSASVQPASSPASPPELMPRKDSSFDGTYQPNYGEEVVDIDRFASYDTGRRYDNTDAQIQSNFAEGVAFPDGTPMSDRPSLSMRGMEPTAPSFGTVSEVAVPKMPLSLGEKIGKGASAVTKGLEKAAPAISAITTLGSGISEMNQRKEVIGDLRDSVGQLTGTIANLSNEDAATEDAMFDEFTEGRRRAGATRNLQLGDRLDAIKGSNLNTGSIKQLKKDIIGDIGTRTDIDLATMSDSYEEKRDAFTIDSRDKRAKMNEQLKKLQDQLAEEEKQQKMAPFSIAADLAIGAVSVASPLVGIGLSAVKNRAMG